MVEHLYSVGIRHKKTGKKTDLFVWTESTDQATHKLTEALFGVNGEYAWTGSGLIYKNNKLVTRNDKEGTA